MISLLGVPLCGLANRMRGSEKAGRLVGAAIMLLALFVFGVPYLWIAILGGLWLLGASFGWTKWLHAMKDDIDQTDYNKRFLGDDTGRKDGSFYIARWIANSIGKYESSDYHAFGIVGFFIRGLYWWVPFYVGVAVMTGAPFMAVVGAFVSALFLPVSYKFGYAALAPKSGPKHEEGFLGLRYLQRSEILYGLLYGIVMWFVLVWAPKLG